MIPEQLKSMAASYPGSPITTAAIEKAYQKRIPQGITESGALLDLLEQWDAESPFEQMMKKTSTSSIPTRRNRPDFDTEGIYFDGDEYIRFDFEGSADVTYSARLPATINTSGSTSLCLSDLDGEYETIDALAQDIYNSINEEPDMEVDWDAEPYYDSHGDCEVDWGSGEIQDIGGSELRCAQRERRELAEFLVENGFITLTEDNNDDN